MRSWAAELDCYPNKNRWQVAVTHVTTCLTLEDVMPSKINLTQKDKEDCTSGGLGTIPVSDTKLEGGFQ